MAIVRTVEWKLACSAPEAKNRIAKAMTDVDLHPEDVDGGIRGHSKTSILKNRWTADVLANVIATGGDSSQVTWRIDMKGNKHYALLDEIAEKVGDDVFDDRGIGSAVDRLAKASRLFGRKEIRHVRNLIYGTERVVELGQGIYGGKQGIVVLTSERLFFLGKSLGSETIEEFTLAAIHSLSVSKKLGGEKLTIHASGNQSEIKQMMHGQADAVVRAFRSLKSGHVAGGAPVQSNSSGDDPLQKLEKLAELHSKGVLSDDEFAAKKKELMGRI